MISRSWIILTIIFFSCTKEKRTTTGEVFCLNKDYETEKVIIVVIDGPRMSETWEHPSQEYIPYLANELSRRSTIGRELHNLGSTYTIPGHIALTTGSYDFKTNDGSEYPSTASMFQLYLKCSQKPPSDAYIITSKKKLAVLGETEDLAYRNSYRPSVDAEERSDIDTYRRALEILKFQKPSLSLIHFKGPDTEGHGGRWDGYIRAIIETDSLLNEIVQFVDSNPDYKGKTAILMTNDHGRHLDGIADGFVSHGDHCRGCTHINFMAYGPDFKTDEMVFEPYEIIDILPTVGELLGFDVAGARGQVMKDIFKNLK